MTLKTKKNNVQLSVCFRPEGENMDSLSLSAGSSYIRVPADSLQVNWRISPHKGVCPIICKAVDNDSSCEASMHHFQADLSLTSHSRVLLIQIYIWQDTLWAYIKWIRTTIGHWKACWMEENALSKDKNVFCLVITNFQFWLFYKCVYFFRPWFVFDFSRKQLQAALWFSTYFCLNYLEFEGWCQRVRCIFISTSGCYAVNLTTIHFKGLYVTTDIWFFFTLSYLTVALSHSELSFCKNILGSYFFVCLF